MLLSAAFISLEGLTALGAPALRGVVHDTSEQQRDHLPLGHPVVAAQLYELLEALLLFQLLRVGQLALFYDGATCVTPEYAQVSGKRVLEKTGAVMP